MYLPDEEEERGSRLPAIYTVALVSALILIILGVVLVSNRQNRKSGSAKAAVSASPAAQEDDSDEDYIEFADEDIETLYKEHKLRAEDLDFWDMYEDSGSQLVVEDSPSPSAEPSPSASVEPTEEELASDGKHVKVSYKDGTEEWVEIDENLDKADIDYTKLKTTNGKMVYYSGNKKLSRLGLVITDDSGTVDFETLAEGGVDFVMLQLGKRGYGTGVISLSDSFTERIAAARSAGLSVGVIFTSQAVTVEEAVEEAQFVTDQLLSYTVDYPVALQLSDVYNDTARTDVLDEEDRTEIAEAFLKDVESAGYDSILYAEGNYILSELLPSELLKTTDVWLDDQNAVPEFPYAFKMWEYGDEMTISGVEKTAAYVISFVDYASR